MFYKRTSVQEIKFEMPSYNAFRRSLGSSMSLFERSTSPLFCTFRKSNICEHSYYEQDEYRQRSSVQILSEKKAYVRESILNEKKSNKSLIRLPALSTITCSQPLLNKLSQFSKKKAKRTSIIKSKQVASEKQQISSSSIEIAKMCSGRIDAYNTAYTNCIQSSNGLKAWTNKHKTHAFTNPNRGSCSTRSDNCDSKQEAGAS